MRNFISISESITWRENAIYLLAATTIDTRQDVFLNIERNIGSFKHFYRTEKVWNTLGNDFRGQWWQSVDELCSAVAACKIIGLSDVSNLRIVCRVGDKMEDVAPYESLHETQLPLNHPYRNYAFNVVEQGPETALRELDRIQAKIKKAMKACRNLDSQFYGILTSYVPLEMDKESYDAQEVARALCNAQTAIVRAQRSPEGGGDAGRILHEGYQVGDRVRIRDGRIGTISEVTGNRYKVAFDLEEAVPQKPLTPAEMTARKDAQAQQATTPQAQPNQKQPAGQQTQQQPAGAKPAPAGAKPAPAGTNTEENDETNPNFDPAAGEKAKAYLKSNGVIT